MFALGLGISGMTMPGKVIGFLDVFGNWDPSLALVMLGAIGVHLLPSIWTLRLDSPVLDDRFHLSSLQTIDRRLVAGAALFGLGWGLAGFCPGPAVVAAGVLQPQAVVFLVAMVGGMASWEVVLRVRVGAPSRAGVLSEQTRGIPRRQEGAPGLSSAVAEEPLPLARWN